MSGSNPSWWDRFDQVWGSGGLYDDPTPAQAQAGWAYIGQAPPTVEQFNSVESWSDAKDNWLYNEIVNVITAAGGTPDPNDLNGLLDAIQLLGRKRLKADLNLYVSVTGNDSHDGLTSGTAFATMQHAWNQIVETIDMSGFNIVVHVAAGNHTQGLAAQGSPVGFGIGNSITFAGDPGANLNTANQHCFTAQNGTQLNISGFAMTASGSVSGTPSCLIIAGPGSSITFTPGNMIFGGAAGSQIWASGGTITINTGYTVNGNGQAHFNATTSGIILFAGTAHAITVSGSPTFSTAFASAFTGGNIEVFPSQVTFTGAATGTRYVADMGGIIWTNGAGANFFPGSVAGTTGRGGQYG